MEEEKKKAFGLTYVFFFEINENYGNRKKEVFFLYKELILII